MTTDQLERDLTTLAEPQPGDERLQRAIRALLDEQVHARPRRRRRTRLLLGSGAVAAATAATAIVALIGTGGSAGPSPANAAILAHVAHAMSPPDIIVHVKEAGTQPDGTPVAVEWWQETSPPYALRVIKGTAGQLHEGAADGTTSSRYDAATNTIYQQPDSSSPTLVDPVESVRAGLLDGTAQVAGTVTIGGRSLYKLTLPNGVVGYFDRTDFRPVYLDNPQGDGTVVRTRVLAYDELSPTSENAQLLSLTAQHPDARVQASPAPDKGKPAER